MKMVFRCTTIPGGGGPSAEGERTAMLKFSHVSEGPWCLVAVFTDAAGRKTPIANNSLGVMIANLRGKPGREAEIKQLKKGLKKLNRAIQQNKRGVAYPPLGVCHLDSSPPCKPFAGPPFEVKRISPEPFFAVLGGLL